jgi:hypothetical protein
VTVGEAMALVPVGMRLGLDEVQSRFAPLSTSLLSSFAQSYRVCSPDELLISEERTFAPKSSVSTQLTKLVSILAAIASAHGSSSSNSKRDCPRLRRPQRRGSG